VGYFAGRRYWFHRYFRWAKLSWSQVGKASSFLELDRDGLGEFPRSSQTTAAAVLQSRRLPLGLSRPCWRRRSAKRPKALYKAAAAAVVAEVCILRILAPAPGRSDTLPDKMQPPRRQVPTGPSKAVGMGTISQWTPHPLSKSASRLDPCWLVVCCVPATPPQGFLPRGGWRQAPSSFPCGRKPRRVDSAIGRRYFRGRRPLPCRSA
jgi:hypothetical protein